MAQRINNKEMDIYIDQYKIGIELDGSLGIKKIKRFKKDQSI